MNVQQIVDRILDFGLNETDADNVLETRILGDVNEIYNSIQGMISSIATPDYLETETVAVTAGVGTVTSHLRNFSVYDTTNKRMLTETDLLTLEGLDKELSTTGAPTCYYITGGTTINTYPISDTSLRFRYYPQPNVLALTDAEADIRLPVHLHDVLVQGGNYLTTIREDGFHDRLSRGEKIRNWLNSQADVTGYLSNKNKTPLRVKYHD